MTTQWVDVSGWDERMSARFFKAYSQAAQAKRRDGRSRWVAIASDYNVDVFVDVEPRSRRHIKQMVEVEV